MVSNALTLAISAQTSTISNGLLGYNDEGKDYLFNINWLTNSLQLYDVDQAKLIKEIRFAREGPNGVGRVFGFHVLSFDSLLLFTQRGAEVVLTDTSGTVKNKISYQPPLGFTAAFVHNAYFISQPIVYGHKLIVKAHIEGNYREMTQARLQTFPLAYSINLHNGETEPLPATYPGNYMSDGLRFFEYSMAGNGKKLAFSFFGDHRLFYVDTPAEKQLQTVDSRSQYLGEKFPLFPVAGGRADTYRYLFASDRYESLLYDPFRNIYYRIAVPGAEDLDENRLRELRTAPVRFSILILNQNLEPIGEHLLADNTYLPQNIFIGSKGLYISTSHPNNKEAKEDFLSFDLLKVTFR